MEDTKRLAELSPSISTQLENLRHEKLELQDQLNSLGFGMTLRQGETGVVNGHQFGEAGLSVLTSAQKRSRMSIEGNSIFVNESSISAKRRK